MNRAELYQKSIDTLVNAYHNDTLVHGNCKACAVGNLLGTSAWSTQFVTISSIIDAEPHQLVTEEEDQFICAFSSILGSTWRVTNFSSVSDLPRAKRYVEEGKKAIKDSGYTKEELMKIEYAFETQYIGEDPMFNALMAVVGVLDLIHEVDNEEVTLSSKSKFQKQLI